MIFYEMIGSHRNSKMSLNAICFSTCLNWYWHVKLGRYIMILVQRVREIIIPINNSYIPTSIFIYRLKLLFDLSETGIPSSICWWVEFEHVFWVWSLQLIYPVLQVKVCQMQNSKKVIVLASLFFFSNCLQELNHRYRFD